MDRHTLHQLIVSLAPGAWEIDEIHSTEDGRWAFGFNDGMAIVAEWSDKPQCLGLTCHIGIPEENTRLRAYELMLSINQFKPRDYILRAALADNGELCLVREVDMLAITEAELLHLLTRFAAVGRRWQNAIGGQIPVAAEPDDSNLQGYLS